MAPKPQCLNPHCLAARERQSLKRRRSATISGIITTSNISTRTIQDLPLELVYKIFDLLDPIDCTCFGLTAKRFYAVLRHLYGSVPLSCQRMGPNDMEWTWSWSNLHKNQCSCSTRLQNTIQDTNVFHTIPRLSAPLPDKCLGFCRHCGANRCELHRHLYCWMGVDDHLSEYCYIMERFLPPADNSSVRYCFLTKPGWPRRCGKHSSNDIMIPTTMHQMVKI